MSKRRYVVSLLRYPSLHKLDQAADELQVQWAVKNKVKFLAQNGGHGWTTTWNIGKSDILINLRRMNNVSVLAKEGYSIIEAGALVEEVIDAAYAEKTHVGASSRGIFHHTRSG